MVDGTASSVGQASRAARSRPAARHRSRAGCSTCKKKHVKCDETKPSCRMCRRKGLTCGGYSRGLTWSYKHQPTPSRVPREQLRNQRLQATERHDGSASWRDIPVLELPQVDACSSPSGLLFGPSDLSSELLVGNESQSVLDSASEPTAFLQDGSLAVDLGSRASFSSQGSPSLDLSHPAFSMRLESPQTTQLHGGANTTIALINNWFDQVCPAWSAFDSCMNPNRKIASELWHHSATVFNCLQSMSACFLSARLPEMRRPALELLRTATACIQAEANVVRNKAYLETVPAGLLFSLFGLGTSVCWLDAGRLGLPFLREAKGLLRRISKQPLAIDERQLEMLSFFKKSLVYWEMLLSAVEDLDLTSDLEIRMQNPPLSEGGCTDLSPHPWTGASAQISRLFSQSIRLCRSYRQRLTGSASGTILHTTALQDIQEACDLEGQLLELKLSSISPTKHTGDQRTPWFHLACVAEAYQLGSLLQLYVTFPELVLPHLPLDSGFFSHSHVSWDAWIIPLTLRLIKLLERIPPESGSRVIQPLLYICASTGLRYDISPLPIPVSFHASDMSLNRLRTEAHASQASISDYIDQIDCTESMGQDAVDVPQLALEVCNARAFILNRLDMLEKTLQPKPIEVAKQLIQAIWASYDNELPGCHTVHWLDVMESQNLRSLFG